MSTTHTVESGYHAHALIGIIVEKYALNNELRLIARINVRPRLQKDDVIAIRLPRLLYLYSLKRKSQTEEWRVK